MVRVSRARARVAALTSSPPARLLRLLCARPLAQPPALSRLLLIPLYLPTHALLHFHACTRYHSPPPAPFAPPPCPSPRSPSPHFSSPHHPPPLFFSSPAFFAPHLPSTPSTLPLTPPLPCSRGQHRQLDAQQVQHLELHRLALSTCCLPIQQAPPKTCKWHTARPCPHELIVFAFARVMDGGRPRTAAAAS